MTKKLTNREFGKYPAALAITRIIRSAIIVLVLLFTTSIVSKAQQAGDPDLPVPEIKVDSYSAQNQDPTEGVFAIISWTVNTEDQLGYKLEIQEQGTDKKYVAALFSPDAPGVDTTTTGGIYKTDVFQPNKKYDIWVTAYTRDSKESVPGTFTLDTAPAQTQNCAETFSTVTKQRGGDLVMFDWNDICKNSKTATTYKIYKNGQLFGEVDESDSFYATSSNPPEGTTWKIEAYGEEPPNTDPSVIKNCDTVVNGQPYSEIVTKMRAKSGVLQSFYYGRTAVPVGTVDNCQIQGTWLRAIIKFDEYRDDSTLQPPAGWLGGVIVGLGNNNVPYFNFVTGQFPVPGSPGNNFFNGFVRCLNEGQNGTNRFGSTVDPWNQLPWTCHASYSYRNYHTYYTERFWVNFDLNAQGGGTSIWPVTTTFTY